MAGSALMILRIIIYRDVRYDASTRHQIRVQPYTLLPSPRVLLSVRCICRNAVGLNGEPGLRSVLVARIPIRLDLAVTLWL